jgi:hypothetical protein
MKTCSASLGDFMTLFFGMALTLLKTILSGIGKNLAYFLSNQLTNSFVGMTMVITQRESGRLRFR